MGETWKEGTGTFRNRVQAGDKTLRPRGPDEAPEELGA